MQEHSKEYSKVSIDSFLSFPHDLPCDIFLKLNQGKFAKVFAQGHTVDPHRLGIYRQKGAHVAWIRRADRAPYMTSTESLIKKMLENNECHDSSFQYLIDDLATQCLECIFDEKKVTPSMIGTLQTTITAFSNLVIENLSGFMFLLGQAKKKERHIRHLVQTSLLSILLANVDGHRDPEVLSIIGLTGLLHDIGLIDHPELDETSTHNAPETKDLVEKHPFSGSQLLNLQFFPKEVRAAIEQHHEAWNGSGFPRGLQGEKIYYPARVVSIADRFSALTSSCPGRLSLTPELALLSLRQSNQYDPNLLKKFVQLLSPAKQASN